MLNKCCILTLLLLGFSSSLFAQGEALQSADEPVAKQPPARIFHVDLIEELLQSAQVEFQNNLYESAIDGYRYIIQHCEKSDDPICHQALVQSYNGLTDVYLEQALHEEALQYSTQALEYADLYGDQLLLAKTHFNHGNVLSLYFEANVDPITNKPYDDSFALLPARARAAYLKAANSFEVQNGKNDIDYIKSISRIGTTYIQEDKYNLAENYYQEAYSLSEKIENKEFSIFILQNLSFIYSQTQKHNESIQIANNLMERVDSTAFETQANIHYILSTNYEQLGNLRSSLFHYKQYNRLKDLYNNYEEQQNLMAIKEQFENEKLQNENLELETASLSAKNKAQRAYLLSGIAGVAFLLLLGVSLILSLRYRYQQQNLQLKMIRNEQDAEIRSINSMIDGREQERSEIGRFLHDQVASLLNSANLHLEVLSQKYEIDHPMFQKTQTILDDVADKVRSLSHQLLSDVLLKFGLIVALDDLCERLTTPLLEFDFSSNIETGKRYKKGLEDRLYSVAQELTNNIIKHSKADRAEIILNEEDEQLYLQVQDNGIGFSQQDLDMGGTGLKQIGLRVKSLGGNLSINTTNLTSIKISFPLAVAEKRKSFEEDTVIQFE